MTKFYARTVIGNGYQCGCCRHESSSSISEETREKFISELFSDYKWNDGDIKLSCLRGITEEEITELFVKFDRLIKLNSEKEDLDNDFAQAKRELERMKKYQDIVDSYSSKT